MTRRLILSLLGLALVAVACSDDDASTSATASAPVATAHSTEAGSAVSTAEYQAFRAQPVACGAEAPPEATDLGFSAPDDLGLSGIVTATIATSCGDITVELDADAAPATVNSFVFLAQQGYFDATVSHRIVPGFVIQMGDPTATGRGGPGYVIPDELPDPGFLYTRGTLAMANAGPNTGGSQFFLVLADASLPPNFTPFGMVVSGLDVMDRIAQIPTVARAAGLEPSSPTETIYIETVEIDG